MKYYEVSANYVVESVTEEIADQFKCSRPRPRNKVMGFKGENRRKAKRVTIAPFSKGL